MVIDRLGLITRFIATANSKLDQYEGEPQKQELALKLLFLSWFQCKLDDKTLDALTGEIEDFLLAYRKVYPLISG